MIISLAFALFVVAAILEGIELFAKGRRLAPWALAVLGLGEALLLAGLVARSLEIRFVAVTSLYETLVLFAAALGGISIAYRVRAKEAASPILAFGATVIVLGLLALASSPLAPQGLKPPVPALRSAWLVLHVAFAFLGESFFAAAFVASLAYLLGKDEKKKISFDKIAYRAIAAGYPIYTLGALVFGAIWAEKAWGRWWSWDPKETWAAVTWLVYTAYLHLRLVAGKRGRATALLAVLGFLLALFTLLGVGYLFRGGLHSYGA